MADGQSRLGSATEAVAGTAIGFCVSWAVTPPVLALFGYQAGAGTAFGITCVYTAISVVRGYLVRRLFNRLGSRYASGGVIESAPRPAGRCIGCQAAHQHLMANRSGARWVQCGVCRSVFTKEPQWREGAAPESPAT